MSLSLLSPTSGQLNLDLVQQISIQDLLQKALKIACFGLPNVLKQSSDPSQTVTTDKKDEEMADVEDKGMTTCHGTYQTCFLASMDILYFGALQE